MLHEVVFPATCNAVLMITKNYELLVKCQTWVILFAARNSFMPAKKLDKTRISLLKWNMIGQQHFAPNRCYTMQLAKSKILILFNFFRNLLRNFSFHTLLSFQFASQWHCIALHCIASCWNKTPSVTDAQPKNWIKLHASCPWQSTSIQIASYISLVQWRNWSFVLFRKHRWKSINVPDLGTL